MLNLNSCLFYWLNKFLISTETEKDIWSYIWHIPISIWGGFSYGPCFQFIHNSALLKKKLLIPAKLLSEGKSSGPCFSPSHIRGRGELLSWITGHSEALEKPLSGAEQGESSAFPQAISSSACDSSPPVPGTHPVLQPRAAVTSGPLHGVERLKTIRVRQWQVL